MQNGDHTKSKKEIVGIDVFVNSAHDVNEVHKKLSPAVQGDLKLTFIGNRGVRVWPESMPETSCGDSWRCRFMSKEKGQPVSHKQIAALLQRFAEAHIDFTQAETLCTFDGVPGYTLSQDEQ